ncbi:phosphoribosyltransferase family protein [Portibacter marinus]|uniref:phosphoribosyltransferase family protein n=1 Tax=Portibacter marinus TaxID=2898660 RepID=UPI001F402F7C|nr:phosphoribosyltransferase family protein [Portibacter marinus]
MKVLNHDQIKQKITRLAIEILEHNFDEKEIVLLGMNNTGYSFATLLESELKKIYDQKLTIKRISINPKSPLKNDATIEDGEDYLKGKTVIIVDDVANTGRTIFYAFKPILNVLPKKVEVAVLVNRKHKNFPVKVDYMGLELATTVKESIKVDISEEGNFEVNLV